MYHHNRHTLPITSHAQQQKECINLSIFLREWVHPTNLISSFAVFYGHIVHIRSQNLTKLDKKSLSDDKRIFRYAVHSGSLVKHGTEWNEMEKANKTQIGTAESAWNVPTNLWPMELHPHKTVYAERITDQLETKPCSAYVLELSICKTSFCCNTMGYSLDKS